MRPVDLVLIFFTSTVLGETLIEEDETEARSLTIVLETREDNSGEETFETTVGVFRLLA